MRTNPPSVDDKPCDCDTRIKCPERILLHALVQSSQKSLMLQEQQDEYHRNLLDSAGRSAEPPLLCQGQKFEEVVRSNEDTTSVTEGTGSDSGTKISNCCTRAGSELQNLTTNEKLPTGERPQKSRKPYFQLQLPDPRHDLTLTTIVNGGLDRLATFANPILLTPPEEVTQLLWCHPQNLKPHPADLTPPSDRGSNIELQDGSKGVCEKIMPTDRTDEQDTEPRVEPSESQQNSDGDALINAMNLVVQTVVEKAEQSIDRRVVVQVLPSPLKENDMQMPLSLWQALLDRLVASRPLTPRWISAIHAVPRNYPMEEIPASTPSTPTTVGGGEASDYFAPQKIVHTAAFMVDQYDVFAQRASASTPGLASSPRSVDVALYQRLIPPATAQEVNELFDINSPSALIDRLTELGQSGCLLFFYPTKTGAETFKREYLNRGLEALIRSILLAKGLPLEACGVVAKLASLEAIPHFGNMEIKLRRFVKEMSSSNIHEGTFSIPSSGRAYVELPAKAWKAWWVRQEEARVKEVIDHYLKLMATRPNPYRDERHTARGITREIMNGLALENDSDAADLPPIEVGVFVIKRNG